MLEKIADQSLPAPYLTLIAECLFLQRNRKMAADVAERILLMAGMITNEEEKAKALRAVALVLATAGKDLEAKNIIDKVLAIAKPQKIVGEHKEDAFAGIAKALVKFDNLDRALAIAEQIENTYLKADIELAVSEAKQQAKAIEITNVVLPMVRAEEVELALATLENMKCHYVTKGYVLSDMALALAELGKDIDSITSVANKALMIIETETNEYITVENKEFILKKLARAFAKANDFDSAILSAEKIKDRNRKSESLADIARFFLVT